MKPPDARKLHFQNILISWGELAFKTPTTLNSQMAIDKSVGLVKSAYGAHPGKPISGVKGRETLYKDGRFRRFGPST